METQTKITNLNLDLTQTMDVIIIGGGPAGTTASIYTARAGLKTLVIDKGLTAGALGLTGKIANYPGIPEIKGSDLVDQMRAQALAFGTHFLTDKVIGVDLNSEIKSVFTNLGTYTGKAIIIATGSMGRKSLVKGEQEFVGRGVSYCAVCDAAFFRGKHVLVAGNNDEAIEEALYLSRFAGKVTFLSPTPELKAPQHLIDEVIAKSNVEIFFNAVLREILGEKQVESVRFSIRGEGEQTLPINGVFVYLQGGQPITDFLMGQLETSEAGCLLVDRHFQTKIPGVFAVGDVLCNHIKQAVIAAGDGATAGIAVEKYLSGRERVSYDWAK